VAYYANIEIQFDSEKIVVDVEYYSKHYCRMQISCGSCEWVGSEVDTDRNLKSAESPPPNTYPCIPVHRVHGYTVLAQVSIFNTAPVPAIPVSQTPRCYPYPCATLLIDYLVCSKSS
jgi:hypothetical protein